MIHNTTHFQVVIKIVIKGYNLGRLKFKLVDFVLIVKFKSNISIYKIYFKNKSIFIL